MRRLQFWRKPLALLLSVGALALAAWQLPLEWLQSLNPFAVIGVGAFLLAAFVPRTAISLACGALFGAYIGAAVSLSAAAIAATVTFLAGRWGGRELVARYAGARLTKLDKWLAARGVLAVVVVRLQPLGPFGFVGYVYGTTSVAFRHFLLGTTIGGIPSSFAYATIGAAVVGPASLSWVTFVPAGLGLAVAATAALHWRRTALRAA